MKTRAESKPYMVALVPAESLNEVVLRLGTLREALAYCRGFNEEGEHAGTCAVIAPDTLPEPPFVGSTVRAPQ